MCLTLQARQNHKPWKHLKTLKLLEVGGQSLCSAGRIKPAAKRVKHKQFALADKMNAV
jgi:hypothetical protein